MRSIVLFLLVIPLQDAFAAQLNQSLGIVMDDYIHFWHSSVVPKKTMDAAASLEPKSNYINITDPKLKKEILAAYSLKEKVEIVDLSSGKKSQHKIEKLTLTRDSGDCVYKYKNYFGAAINSKLNTVTDGVSRDFLGIALPSSMKMTNVPHKIINQIDEYFSKDKEVKRFRGFFPKSKKKPFVLGISDASVQYFISVYPVADAGATYYIFQIKGQHIEKIGELDFPMCGT